MRASHRDTANALIVSAAKQAEATGFPAPAPAPPTPDPEPERVPSPAEVEAAATADPRPRKAKERTPTAYGFTVPRSALDTDQTVQLGLRIPRRLHAALRAAAYLNDKSIQDLATEAIAEKLLALSNSDAA